MAKVVQSYPAASTHFAFLAVSQRPNTRAWPAERPTMNIHTLKIVTLFTGVTIIVARRRYIQMDPVRFKVIFELIALCGQFTILADHS